MHSWAMEYDYMGRRISQSGRRKGSYDYSPCTNYLYNDYLLIEEHQFQPGPYGYDRTFGYLWDPIAGMASRPLMMLDYQNNSFFYTHDANKNITELVDDSGKIVTHYEYSPFGTLTVPTASTANPFTFSSEYFDSSLGLIYYNYRHYNPTDGRWLSRDPIEEKGGWNLYGMVNNNIENIFDVLGNMPFTIIVTHGTQFTHREPGTLTASFDCQTHNITITIEPNNFKYIYDNSKGSTQMIDRYDLEVEYKLFGRIIKIEKDRCVTKYHVRVSGERITTGRHVVRKQQLDQSHEVNEKSPSSLSDPIIFSCCS